MMNKKVFVKLIALLTGGRNAARCLRLLRNRQQPHHRQNRQGEN